MDGVGLYRNPWFHVSRSMMNMKTNMFFLLKQLTLETTTCQFQQAFVSTQFWWRGAKFNVPLKQCYLVINPSHPSGHVKKYVKIMHRVHYLCMLLCYIHFFRLLVHKKAKTIHLRFLLFEILHMLELPIQALQKLIRDTTCVKQPRLH